MVRLEFGLLGAANPRAHPTRGVRSIFVGPLRDIKLSSGMSAL